MTWRARSTLIALVALSALLVASSGRTVAQPKAAPVASTGAWTVYHHDDGHTGYDSTLPNVSSVTTGWVSSVLDEQVYASPLVYNGIVYAATLNNSVYALRQTDGTLVWQDNFGAPETTGWQCGNVSPMGILGTPVIDAAGGRLYAAVLTSTDQYWVYGVSLATGAVQLSTQIPATIGTGFDWTIQQQRGALAVGNGYVYVPFGGRAGDCGSYHGWVVGVPTSGSTSLAVYETPDTGIGIWTSGGVVVDDATGNVFAATGNGVASGCSAVNQNDAVVRLSPTLALQDYFMPLDWQANWCGNDQDLGSASPLLISPNLMFQAGKWGGGFLLNPNNLGGVDGQLFPTPKPGAYSQAEVCLGNHSDATFGSFAYAAPYIYLECEGRGIVALNANTAAPSFVPCGTGCGAPDWEAGPTLTFGPPIVAAGAVWAADNGGGLYAFNAMTGALIFHSAGFGINRFVTPAEAGGQVFVPSHNVIRDFDMHFTGWASQGGVLTSAPEVTASSASRADVFVRGTDNGMWQTTWNGTTWSPWQAHAGVLTSNPGAVALGASRIDVFVRGSDNRLWHQVWSGGWSPWQPLGGGLTSGPGASGWTGPTHIDVFVRGTDGQLWHKWSDGNSWFPWEPLGGQLSSDPGSVSWGPNRIDVFVRGSDLQLWHKYWDGVQWRPWEPLGGTLGSAPEAASCASGHLDVFVLGTSNDLWKRSFSNGAWGNWTPQGGYWTADPGVACVPGTTNLIVAERGSDSALWTETVTGT